MASDEQTRRVPQHASPCISVWETQLSVHGRRVMILVEQTPAALTFVVRGAATMAESGAVHGAALAALARGTSRLRFDLRDGCALDSTFCGTLLSLQNAAEANGGRLVLVSPSPPVLALLAEMGLADFYAVEEALAPSGPFAVICPAVPARVDPEALRRRILDAHEELARVPQTAPTLRAAIDELRRDTPAPHLN
jgi:anti-anti-sigma regulatory factor